MHVVEYSLTYPALRAATVERFPSGWYEIRSAESGRLITASASWVKARRLLIRAPIRTTIWASRRRGVVFGKLIKGPSASLGPSELWPALCPRWLSALAGWPIPGLLRGHAGPQRAYALVQHACLYL